MLKLLATRVAMSVPLVFLVSLIIFALESLVPGDAARTILGEQATPQSVAAMRQQLGLNRSWGDRYGSWLWDLIHGHLGTSMITGQKVTSALDVRLSVTVSLVLISIVVSAAIGIALGLFSAVRGGVLGRIGDMISISGIALPNFWVGTVLVSVFAVEIQAFPATGYVSPGTSFSAWVSSLVLPVASLSLFGVAMISKQTRDSTMEVLKRDYIRVLRANGVSEARIIGKHVLRNAAIPIMSVIGVVGIGMLGASVFIENVFVLPGLGGLATQATVDHDIPLILGVGVYFTLLVIAINFLVDIAYGLLNPKVRVS